MPNSTIARTANLLQIWSINIHTLNRLKEDIFFASTKGGYFQELKKMKAVLETRVLLQNVQNYQQSREGKAKIRLE